MNPLDFFTNIYSHMRNYHFPIWAMSIPRRIIRALAYILIPRYLEKSPKNTAGKRLEGLIVSFTSFPARIESVWQVVECMLRQTILPSQIILWLSNEQFKRVEDIPMSLRDREGELFKIKLVDGDIRSHKKYLYVCKEYPDSKVLLIDDDIYYPTNFIEKLVRQSISNDVVICNYGSIIKRDEYGELLPYEEWEESYSNVESKDFFFGSGGGVLFCPRKMYSDLTNIDLALELAPQADDVWLNAMVRLAGLKTVKIESGLILNLNNQACSPALYSFNLSQGGNDRQIKALNEYYEKKNGVRVF